MSKSASDKEASSNHDKNDHADEKRVTVGDWSEQLSSTGKRYFYNCKTEVSQWEKPKEFIEWEREQKLSGASLTTNKSKAQSNDKNSNAGSIKSNTGKRTAPKRKEIQTENTTVSEELATDSSVEVPKKKIASIPKKGKGKKATEQAISDTLSSPENGRKETGVSDVHEKKSICNPKRGKGKKATSPTKNETQGTEIGEVDEKKTVQNPKRGKGKKTASSTENQSEETEVGVDNTVNERKSTKQMKGKKTKICKGNSDVHHEEPEVIEEAAIPKVSSSSEERKQNSRSTKAHKGSDKMPQEVPKTAAEESAPEAAAVESASETTAVERGSPEASSAAKKRKQSSRSTNTKKKGRKGASGNENYESLPKGL